MIAQSQIKAPKTKHREQIFQSYNGIIQILRKIKFDYSWNVVESEQREKEVEEERGEVSN